MPILVMTLWVQEVCTAEQRSKEFAQPEPPSQSCAKWIGPLRALEAEKLLMSGAVADPKLPLQRLLPLFRQALPPWLPLVSSQSSHTATGPTSGLIVAGAPVVSQTLLLVPAGQLVRVIV